MPSPNELAGGWSQQNHALWVASSAGILLRYVYTLRLVGSISYLGGCYRRTKVTKCLCQKMTLFSAVLISVCEPLNHIHQDTKSSGLIAVCKRSLITPWWKHQEISTETEVWICDHIKHTLSCLKTVFKSSVSITVCKTWKGSRLYTLSHTPSWTVWRIYALMKAKLSSFLRIIL